MILRRCVVCGKDRGVSRRTCSCGAAENDADDPFKAAVVIPGPHTAFSFHSRDASAVNSGLAMLLRGSGERASTVQGSYPIILC
jgi:hypothetical protein